VTSTPYPFEHFKGDNPPKLSLTIQASKRNPACTPCGNLSNTSRYLISQLCALSATAVLHLSTLVDKFKASTNLHTPCTTYVLHLHFYWNENNGISPELSEINSEPCQRTPCRRFTALLAGTSLSGRETIETNSSLSNFHLT
jgi:hypothetical protein